MSTQHEVATLLRQASELAGQQQWQSAEKIYKKILVIESSNLTATVGLGAVYFYDNQLVEAENVFKKLLVENATVAQGHYFLGVIHLRKQEWQQAEGYLRRSMELKPEVLEIYTALADVFVAQKQWGQAALMLARVLQIKSKEMTLWEKMANIWGKIGKEMAVLEIYRNLLRLQPKNEEIRATLQLLLKKVEQQVSIAKYRQLQQQYNIPVPPLWNECWLQAEKLLTSGKVASGFKELAKYSTTKEYSNRYPTLINIPRWEGEIFSCKRLLIHDEIFLDSATTLLRYLPLVKKRGGIVILAVRPEWMGLVAHISGVDVVINISEQDKLPLVDLQVSLCTLPSLFGTTEKTIPVSCAQKKQKEIDKKKILLSCAPECMTTLQKMMANATNLEFIELSGVASQLDHAVKQLIHAELVITDDIQLCQWAGVIGKECYYLSTYADLPQWWYTEPPYQWYPQTSFYRQTMPGDWLEVIEIVAQSLVQRGEA